MFPYVDKVRQFRYILALAPGIQTKIQLQCGLDFQIQCVKIKEMVTRETSCRIRVSKSNPTLANPVILKFH